MTLVIVLAMKMTVVIVMMTVVTMTKMTVVVVADNNYRRVRAISSASSG